MLRHVGTERLKQEAASTAGAAATLGSAGWCRHAAWVCCVWFSDLCVCAVCEGVWFSAASRNLCCLLLPLCSVLVLLALLCCSSLLLSLNF